VELVLIAQHLGLAAIFGRQTLPTPKTAKTGPEKKRKKSYLLLPGKKK
jgi:hypothetical protein